MQNPENLYVYRVAKALVRDVYEFIDTLPPSERYNLASQIRRSSTSIRNNIRDGCGRQGNRALWPFLYDSHASAGELEDQLDQSLEVNVGDQTQARRLRRRVIHLKISIRHLIAQVQRGP